MNPSSAMTATAGSTSRLTEAALRAVAHEYGTPVFVYDEEAIRETARAVTAAFSWAPGYRNYFAVKACPTPAILRVLANEGMGFDCSSLAELVLVQQSVKDAEIFFTSNNTTLEEYALAHELGATINVDKAPEAERVLARVGIPARMSVRYTPAANESTVIGNSIIGQPTDSKFGDTRPNVLRALQSMTRAGVRELGLHVMLASNELEPNFFAETATLLRDTLGWLRARDVQVGFVNLGGGLGVNYRKTDRLPSFESVSRVVRERLEGLPLGVVTEFGRRITGPHGVLLTRVTHGFVTSHETFLQVDTSINNLPGFASDTTDLHHIEILGRDGSQTRVATVVGSMCTGSDRMFKRRALPETTEPGDLLVVRDTGAHARAKAHNYNLRPRAAEVLVNAEGHRLIRRAETVEDLLATVSGL